MANSKERMLDVATKYSNNQKRKKGKKSEPSPNWAYKKKGNQHTNVFILNLIKINSFKHGRLSGSPRHKKDTNIISTSYRGKRESAPFSRFIHNSF